VVRRTATHPDEFGLAWPTGDLEHVLDDHPALCVCVSVTPARHTGNERRSQLPAPAAELAALLVTGPRPPAPVWLAAGVMGHPRGRFVQLADPLDECPGASRADPHFLAERLGGDWAAVPDVVRRPAKRWSVVAVYITAKRACFARVCAYWASPASDTQTGEFSPKQTSRLITAGRVARPARPLHEVRSSSPAGEAAVTARFITPVIPRPPSRLTAGTADRAQKTGFGLLSPLPTAVAAAHRDRLPLGRAPR
jgi:hypothetical protein